MGLGGAVELGLVESLRSVDGGWLVAEVEVDNWWIRDDCNLRRHSLWYAMGCGDRMIRILIPIAKAHCSACVVLWWTGERRKVTWGE